MKIKLTDIPVYYVNLEGEDEKRKHTESMLKNLGFKYVHRFNAIRHEAGRIIGCARSHYSILSTVEPRYNGPAYKSIPDIKVNFCLSHLVLFNVISPPYKSKPDIRDKIQWSQWDR